MDMKIDFRILSIWKISKFSECALAQKLTMNGEGSNMTQIRIEIELHVQMHKQKREKDGNSARVQSPVAADFFHLEIHT